MKIVLIEDNPAKASLILQELEAAAPSSSVDSYGSYNAGLIALLASIPDLLILDMTLPTFDRAPGSREGRNRPLGGYEIMRKMKTRGVDVPVVVVTQFESFGDGDEKIGLKQLIEKCRTDFPTIFFDCIYYRAGDHSWRTRFSETIQEIQKGTARE